MKLFIQLSAQDDILKQFEWYAGRGLPEIARRYRLAVRQAIANLSANPARGSPKRVSDPRLAELRTWPVAGFDDFRVYYLFDTHSLAVVRILHGKRDIGALLAETEIEAPQTD